MTKATNKKPAAIAAEPRPPYRPGEAQAVIESFGLEYFLDQLGGGVSLTDLAKKINVSTHSLSIWLEGDPTGDRAMQVRQARALGARLWDEKAEEVINGCRNNFELAKARELASHYRWRAKATAPRDYGDRVTQELVGARGGPISVASTDLSGLSDEELAVMQELLQKAEGSPG